MFEILLMAGLSFPPESSPYATKSLHAFAALANDRIIDGVSYTNGDGVLSAGLLYSDPSGFFASTDLAFFEGANLLPAEDIVSLQSAAGWRLENGQDNQFTATLLDYRVDADAGTADHQGAALGFRSGSFAIEYAIEPDKAYFYRQYDTFYTHDAQRVAVSWTQLLSTEVQWSAGIGSARMDGIRGRHDFASGSLLWRWNTLEWQLTVVHAIDPAYAPWTDDAERTQLMLRVARPFRLR